MKNGPWNSIKYEGKIEELQVMNVSNNANLPIYATGDSTFQNNMQQQNKPSKRTDTGIKFYKLNELYQSVDIWINKQIVIPQIKTLDKYGMPLLYATKPGTTLANIESFEGPERTDHNTGPRDSFRLKNNDLLNKAMHVELNMWSNIDFKEDDQDSWKCVRRKHGDSESNQTKRGRCYSMGINTDQTPHLAKEFPYHSTTPKFYP